MGHWAKWALSSHALRLMPSSPWVLMTGERMCLLFCPLGFKPFCSANFSGLIGSYLQGVIPVSILENCGTFKHLGRAQKATPLPLGLAISDLSTCKWNLQEGNHKETMNIFNNLWLRSFYLPNSQNYSRFVFSYSVCKWLTLQQTHVGSRRE